MPQLPAVGVLVLLLMLPLLLLLLHRRCGSIISCGCCRCD
jgi:hypothetical protein